MKSNALKLVKKITCVTGGLQRMLSVSLLALMAGSLLQCTGRSNTTGSTEASVAVTKPIAEQLIPAEQENNQHPKTDDSDLTQFLKYHNQQELIKALGADNVVNEEQWFEEGTVKKDFSRIYEGKDDELSIIWDENGPVVQTWSKEAKWQTRGISTGMSLANLIKLNNAPINFFGFGWDYGGTVVLGNGAIKSKGITVVLGIASEHPDIEKLYGDSEFTSAKLNDKIIQAIEVISISVSGGAL
ncbi:MAG: hypothetical protein JEZ14_18265 [Marinilabiliaceae bacterium]|nr:hypothetical protein [Marinilabiliaceae bacterium]